MYIIVETGLDLQDVLSQTYFLRFNMVPECSPVLTPAKHMFSSRATPLVFVSQ